MKRVAVPLATASLAVGLLSSSATATRPARDLELSPRALIGMATDSNRDIVLFGGMVPNDFGSFDFLGDTWTWDGTSWTEQHPVDAPSTRAGYGIAYDAARRQTVLFGGTDANVSFGDTWTWDGTAWTERHPIHSPSPAAGPGLAYDAARKLIVAIVPGVPNTTWTWDGIDWTQQDPARDPDVSSFMGAAYHGATRQVVTFGGFYFCFEDICYRNSTLAWNGTDWIGFRPTNHPSARAKMGMAYDATRHRTVLFGGIGFSGYEGDTWAWTGRTWQELHPASSPAPREGPGMAWDGARRQIVLFGGMDAPGGFYRPFADTWIWDGFDWTCVAGCV